MKNFRETNIKGVFEIDLFHVKDDRGVFAKPYHKPTLEKHGLHGDFAESFYSTNNRGVVRGMHFQYPPYAHQKLVYCTSGKLVDVVLDIRQGSPTYGQYAEIELSGENFKAVYMPIGVAHGFAVVEDNTCMIYHTATVHHPESDSGILYNSFGYNWPFEDPVTSERDQKFMKLEAFNSPFDIEA